MVSRVKKKIHKYGICIPKSVSDAYELDRVNGNNHWRNAIIKEIENVAITFEKWRQMSSSLRDTNLHHIILFLM